MLVVVAVLHSLLFNVFVMLVVAIVDLHSLLFDVIPHPFVNYRQAFTPILYFKPISSQSVSRDFHFNLSGPFCYSFTASATVLSRRFLPTGVFYLTLLPNIVGTTCFYQAFLGAGSSSLNFARLHADLQNIVPAQLFV